MCDTRPPYLGMPLSQSADQMRLELAPAAKVSSPPFRNLRAGRSEGPLSALLARADHHAAPDVSGDYAPLKQTIRSQER